MISNLVPMHAGGLPNLLAWADRLPAQWSCGTLKPRGNEWVLDADAGRLYRPRMDAPQFADYGVLLDGLRSGHKVRLTAVVDALSAAGDGDVLLRIGFFDRGISLGFSVEGLSIEQEITAPTTISAEIDLPTMPKHVDGASGFDRGGWLSIQTICNAEIGSISIERIV